MRKDIALAGKIDTKHRSRQNLGHGAFSDDLFLLRHCAANILETPRRSTTAQVLGSARAWRAGDRASAIANFLAISHFIRGESEGKHFRQAWRNVLERRVRSLEQSASHLPELFQRQCWHVFAKLLANTCQHCR